MSSVCCLSIGLMCTLLGCAGVALPHSSADAGCRTPDCSSTPSGVDASAMLDGSVRLDGGAGLDGGAVAGPDAAPVGSSPGTRHYTADGNFDSSGNYVPGAYGFNLADVGDASQVSALPTGVMGLVYVGSCNGADSTFLSTLTPFIGSANVFGFYLADEPDPSGAWKPACSAVNLMAESDWIHANLPGAKTFIVLMNMSSSTSPSYANTYNPSNSHVDLYGVDPYPCRTDLNGCDYSLITSAVNAAEASGIPRASIVPVFQSFGGGSWLDDSGGSYQLPTANQANQIFATWAASVPSPLFDYAYSWGVQNGDTALSVNAALQVAFATHNR